MAFNKKHKYKIKEKYLNRALSWGWSYKEFKNYINTSGDLRDKITYDVLSNAIFTITSDSDENKILVKCTQSELCGFFGKYYDFIIFFQTIPSVNIGRIWRSFK